MDRGTLRQSVLFGEHNCPVECVTKSIIFIVLAGLILYLPLGDLSGFCDRSTCGKKSSAYLATSNSNTDNHIAVCCMCDVYKMMTKTGHLAMHTIEMFVYILLDFLYEAKLQFYHLLEVLDRRDLCRSVCCKDDEDSNHNGVNEKRSCRCSKGKTCKYRT